MVTYEMLFQCHAHNVGSLKRMYLRSAAQMCLLIEGMRGPQASPPWPAKSWNPSLPYTHGSSPFPSSPLQMALFGSPKRSGPIA